MAGRYVVVVGLVLLLSLHAATAEEHSDKSSEIEEHEDEHAHEDEEGHDENAAGSDDCGPYGVSHGDHCDCRSGYEYVTDKGCVKAEDHDHDESAAGSVDCGPYGYSHGDHCDCQSGYEFVADKGCVKAEDLDHGDGYDESHSDGRPDWPDCECVLPPINCELAVEKSKRALEQLQQFNCSSSVDTCTENPECLAAFFLLNSIHDGCPDGHMSTADEILYHRYTDACPSCHALSDVLTAASSAELPSCPETTCKDTTAAGEAFGTLLANCSTACSGDVCEDAWHYALSYHALCPDSLTFEQAELYHLLDNSCNSTCEVGLTRAANCSMQQEYAHVFEYAEELLSEFEN